MQKPLEKPPSQISEEKIIDEVEDEHYEQFYEDETPRPEQKEESHKKIAESISI